jgi:hypothetical protein
MVISILFAGNNIANKPYENPNMNIIDAINEIFYYCVLVFAFAFTSFNPDLASKDTIGDVWNSLVYIMMCINCGILISG